MPRTTSQPTPQTEPPPVDVPAEAIRWGSRKPEGLPEGLKMKGSLSKLIIEGRR